MPTRALTEATQFAGLIQLREPATAALYSIAQLEAEKQRAFPENRQGQSNAIRWNDDGLILLSAAIWHGNKTWC